MSHLINSWGVWLSNLGGLPPSEAPHHVIESALDVETKGEEASLEEKMDLTCRRPPVASRAFIFNSFPAASALSLRKHDALMIFFRCASDRLDLTDYSGEVPFRQRLKAIKIFLCPWVTFTASQHGSWQHSGRDFRLVSRYGKSSSRGGWRLPAAGGWPARTATQGLMYFNFIFTIIMLIL